MHWKMRWLGWTSSQRESRCVGGTSGARILATDADASVASTLSTAKFRLLPCSARLARGPVSAFSPTNAPGHGVGIRRR
eukprot:scaffold4349_cov258-Pinguiococcus_pyrenoidosus.AAC.3